MPEPQLPHDIHSFVTASQDAIESEYKRIQKRATEDPGTAGDQGEENWASLLRAWLPAQFHVVTKGRILTYDGYASPQIDVLVLWPSYPRILLDKKMYLAGGVAAAFECKTTLKAEHVTSAVATGALLRQNLPKREGTPYKELNSGIIYGLLAHSHSWTSAGSDPVANIEKSLFAADLKYVKHPRECLDLITVANLASWSTLKITYINPHRQVPQVREAITKEFGENGAASSIYFCHEVGGASQKSYFSPLGVLLSELYSQFAWTLPEMRMLEEYMRRVNLQGSGNGKGRNWGIEIYSEGIRKRVFDGPLSNGPSYDEWRLAF